MDHLRQLAEAFYRASPSEIQSEAHKFFNALDSDGDGHIDQNEFITLMSEENGFHRLSNPSFFSVLDTDCNGTLDFWEVMTLYFIVGSGRPFCDCCGDFIPATYFTCVECGAVNVCIRCYENRRSKHDHGGQPAVFVDNYILLEVIKSSGSQFNSKTDDDDYDDDDDDDDDVVVNNVVSFPANTNTDHVNEVVSAPAKPNTTARPNNTTAKPNTTTTASSNTTTTVIPNTTAKPNTTTIASSNTTTARPNATAKPNTTTIASSNTTTARPNATAKPNTTTTARPNATAKPNTTTTARPNTTVARPNNTTAKPNTTNARPRPNTYERPRPRQNNNGMVQAANYEECRLAIEAFQLALNIGNTCSIM